MELAVDEVEIAEVGRGWDGRMKLVADRNLRSKRTSSSYRPASPFEPITSLLNFVGLTNLVGYQWMVSSWDSQLTACNLLLVPYREPAEL